MSSLVMMGRENSPLLIVDGDARDAAAVARIAGDLAPFPPARGSAYPGLRRFIGPADTAAATYARGLLRRLAPAINAAFGVDGFDLLQASFSMVTVRPDALTPTQRTPHFDSTEPLYLAVLHYIDGVAGSGTAFYRQQATGIERVTPGNVAGFVAAAQRDAEGATGYIHGSTAAFTQIGAVEAVPDRVVVYQGSLLHSGTIPDDMSFSDDPSRGRLTANFFVRGRPRRTTSGG